MSKEKDDLKLILEKLGALIIRQMDLVNLDLCEGKFPTRIT